MTSLCFYKHVSTLSPSNLVLGDQVSRCSQGSFCLPSTECVSMTLCHLPYTTTNPLLYQPNLARPHPLRREPQNLCWGNTEAGLGVPVLCGLLLERSGVQECENSQPASIELCHTEGGELVSNLATCWVGALRCFLTSFLCSLTSEIENVFCEL